MKVAVDPDFRNTIERFANLRAFQSCRQCIIAIDREIGFLPHPHRCQQVANIFAREHCPVHDRLLAMPEQSGSQLF